LTKESTGCSIFQTLFNESRTDKISIKIKFIEFKKDIFFSQHFFKSPPAINLQTGLWVATKNVGRVGLAVYWIQTERQAKFRYKVLNQGWNLLWRS